MSRQVRLDDDVVEALERLARRVDPDQPRSIAHHANRKLRQVLGIGRQVAASGAGTNARVSGVPKGRRTPQGRRRPSL